MISLFSNILSRLLVDRKGGHRRKVIDRYHELVRLSKSSSEDITAYQNRKLAELLKHAALHVPVVKKHLMGKGPVTKNNAREMLRCLPVMERNLIQANPESYLSDHLNDAVDDATGGSTGTPMIFKVDQRTQISREASLYWSNHLAGWRYGDRVAMLWGSDRDIGNAKKDPRLEFRWWVDNMRWYNAFDMGEDRMHEFHEDMCKFRPHLVVAYSGSLWIYSQFLEKNGLTPPYPLKGLVSSAEVLTPEMRTQIERVFQKAVFNRYGNRETGAIGGEDASHKGFVVNEGDFIVEIDSADPINDPGPILLTYLSNYAMPFIRYNTGDLGVWDQEAGDHPGQRRIARIVGREADTIKTAGGKLIHGEYFTHLMYGQKSVQQFQFVQETLDYYRLLVVLNSPVDEGIKKMWRAKIAEHIGADSKIDVEEVESIPVLKSGKHKFTLSKVKI